MTDRALEFLKAAFVPELKRLSSSIDALNLGQEKIVAHLKLVDERHEAFAQNMAAQAKQGDDRHQALLQQMAGNQQVVEKQIELLDKKLDHLDRKTERLEQKVTVLDQDLRDMRLASDAVWSGVKQGMHQQERRLDRIADVLGERAPSGPLPER